MNLRCYALIDGQDRAVSAGLNIDLATIVAGKPMGEMLRSFIRINIKLFSLS